MKQQANGFTGRISFGRIPSVIETPDLLNVQIDSFNAFLQADTPAHRRKKMGLQQVFETNFPILDARENFLLEFSEYYVEKAKYSVVECQERGLTYAVPLKAKLRLSQKREGGKEFTDTIEQEVYLGNLPAMTARGTFIINGAERVVVSQLHRSPGVFFGESIHPNGTVMYSARIIPFRGSWVEFATDINNVMYAYIDRKKKFPVTTLLRALGFSSDDAILDLFDLVEEIDVAKVDLKDYLERMVCSDVFDRKTGEIFISKDTKLTDEHIKHIKKAGIKKIRLLKADASTEASVIANTMMKDASRSEEDALEAIYSQLRSGEAPDLDTAKNLIDRLFFNPKRYDLGDVGRHRMNAKLSLNIGETVTVLTKDDIVAIVKYLIDMQQGKRTVDDIDHLGNRRVRTVGEQLAQQFNVGLSRMTRTIRERMNLRDAETITPQDLVNARTITSVINAFFGTNQLSQFLDQTNPLSEMTHKRRVSALGPGGLTRERAGFEVRDVHYTHYGRLCPIETPEGPNIGLISSLCIHARINEFGFIETPYRRVKNGKVSEEIEFLTAEKEDEVVIAQANAPIDERGRFGEDRVKARLQSDYPMVEPEKVQFMDVAPNQIVSAAAALIPFLEHDDANRALMGSNMQRQAVPLLRPEAPIVGTGLEEKIARDSRTVIVAERNGSVESVTGDSIVVEYDIDENSVEAIMSFDDKRRVEYRLTKFLRTNQDTAINQKPVVREGQRFKKGDILVDGCATDKGELALGRNVLVAFMPWRGYNFEDAIIVSERIVAEDVFTSVHVEEFELQVRDTKRGEEELTREIPNVSEEATKDLDENGIIRMGAEVNEGDILIGKITPKGETDPTPEEKLLKAIFGEKAGDVKDASLKAPPGMKGIVISTKLFSRKKKDTESKKEDKRRLESLERSRKRDIQELTEKLARKLDQFLAEEKSAGIRDTDGNVVLRAGTSLKADTFQSLENVDKLDYNQDWVDDKRKQNVVIKIYENYRQKLSEIEELYRHEKNKVQLGDELAPGIVQLAKVYVAKKRKLQVGDKMAGRHGNKGVVSTIVPVEDMPFLPNGRPVDLILNPLGVPSRMNIGQLFELALGWAGEQLGVTFSSPIFDGASWEEVQEYLNKAGVNPNSKSALIDGRTGDKFDQEVTVGYLYMMKLSHMVDDKIHARSIGPYSLITQQPLGGKAQFGGQRFGEMEVWALEGYGASHVLQEILTAKSDDVLGRAKIYEAIVKGENLPEPNVPESFNVLMRELQGLGLEVKIE
ncbi:MAG: DNA-directed RNA polymerase subunit beta [Ignavibacteria bacterium GWA2_55_11]|nr:MAG: DNA-directed RNA polymerase subunit beta [Ignavibacteria bacterium GWA2_55_11]OGU43497.1 MAG: DNA-directed RNA polymerase subunit beta [Ignavibacteria bacterium GWC2_56_12]OGU65012.1 MAG: DNA-directed RNA polymerase subunit beta [Ignavibacteria bacterium RIFCSPHIGHO2_02_FULL_56_12]OGU71912.1 MAG: DNA-directed RNA polymerase subunit beta [Ignavibacteria bacterium RIFCSPLOWO2_12_FULL_56_21]